MPLVGAGGKYLVSLDRGNNGAGLLMPPPISVTWRAAGQRATREPTMYWAALAPPKRWNYHIRTARLFFLFPARAALSNIARKK